MSSRFDISPTLIDGVSIVERKPIGDERGFLVRVYAEDELAQFGFAGGIKQINHTLTTSRGAVRGMHFQHPPHAETKLVTCIRGAVFDVAVDLRAESPTFLQWHGEVLSAENNRALVIPKGCAHGFQALEDDSELIYLHSAAYEPSCEGALNQSDPRLAIDWPLPVTDLSDRDRNHELLADEFKGLSL